MLIDKDNFVNQLMPVLGSIKKGDAFVSENESISTEFENNHIKTIEEHQQEFISLRLFENAKMGNSFINKKSSTDLLIKNAKMSASLGEEIDLQLPSAGEYPALDFFDQNVIDYDKEEVIKLGQSIISDVLSIDNTFKTSVEIEQQNSHYGFANTEGFKGYVHKSIFSLGVNAVKVESDESLLFLGDSFSSHHLKINYEDILSKIENLYQYSRKIVSVKKGRFPVIFAPEALSLIIDPVLNSLDGRSLYKKTSLYENKLGNKMASDKFSLIDDPFHNDGEHSYCFDGEGIVPETLPLFENGYVRNFIYDLYTAQKLGVESNGRAYRSISSLVSPSFSNLKIPEGKISLNDMIKDIRYGLIVNEFLGEGMSNTVAGDFSVNVELGFLIENGKIKGRVKNTMLSGNAFDAINNIIQIENLQHALGSCFFPHISFNNLDVTG